MALLARGKSVRALVTRPREDAQPLVEALAARGVAALIEPMMEILYRDAAVDLTCIRAVLCTSANGVRALARNTDERAVAFYAVGEATAACARAAGFAAVESAAGNAADLARLVSDRLPPQGRPLLHVCGAELAGDLAGALADRGFVVERRVLYEARPVPALSDTAATALAAGDIDAALFFSPRTAAIFTHLVEAAGLDRVCAGIAVVSISPATDAALGAMPWRWRRVAERPDQVGLLASLDGLLAELERG
jgi:uroporphyrinogen-III synthase